MNAVAEFKNKLEEELKTINKKSEMSTSDLDMASKIVCNLKEIEIIEAMEREEHEFMGYGDGTSEAYRNGMIQMPDASYRGSSYRRGSSQRRSPYSYDGRGGSSYNGGYSRHGGNVDMSIRKLEDMLNEAQSEPERQAILAHIEQLENMY